MSDTQSDRLTVTSSRSFEAVLAELEAAIGRPDMVEFSSTIKDARTVTEPDALSDPDLAPTHFFRFARPELPLRGFCCDCI
jgi:hypothetical protein